MCPVRRLFAAKGKAHGLLLAGILLGGVPVSADTGSGQLSIHAFLSGSCTTVTSPTLTFTNVQSIGVPTQPFPGSTTFTVTCGNGAAYNILLGPGGNYSDSRHMGTALQGGPLPYQLYQNSNHQTIWGDGTVATGMAATQSGTSNGSAKTFTIYGQILPGTALPAPGTTLTDSVAITVSF
jgi:spore coat protein U-like protein